MSERLRRHHPAVEVVELGRNVGFGAGCNAGIERLGDCDYIALVNNDATVEPDWLTPLVVALESDTGAGAASPKILFDGRYGAVEVESPTHARGRGDRRTVGVRVSGARVDGEDVWVATQLVSGFWGEEEGEEGPMQHTAGRARLHVPVASVSRATVELRLAADSDRPVTLSAGAQRADHRVGPRADWYAVDVDPPFFDVVNSAGAMLLEGGYGTDRGYLEADVGQYDRPAEVFAWHGAGVVLSRAYLDSVGAFHEPLFLYYEDLDLSWRGWSQGWRHAYVPAAVARHALAAATVEGSALFHHHVERNRLVVLARNAPAPMARRAVLRFLLITASYGRRDIVVALLHGRRPTTRVVARRLRAFAGFLRMLPGALLQRRTLRRRRVRSDGDLLGVLAPAPPAGPTARRPPE